MDAITLQKCKKCWKSLPLEAFININENTHHFKTCNTCHYKASLQYKQSNSEVKLLIPEEMSKQLFEKILEIDTNEYLENSLTSIDFNQYFNWYDGWWSKENIWDYH